MHAVVRFVGFVSASVSASVSVSVRVSVSVSVECESAFINSRGTLRRKKNSVKFQKEFMNAL